jgi:hypothetical protein
MTVTMIGPAGTRVGSDAGPGLRAVLHGIECHYFSVRTGQRVRPTAVGGANSNPGRPREAMRDRMSPGAPTPIEAAS